MWEGGGKKEGREGERERREEKNPLEGGGREKGKKGEEKEKERGWSPHLYVTPWVPRVLGLKQWDEVIIMNLGRAVVHMW